MRDNFSIDPKHPDISPTLARASVQTTRPVTVVSRETHTIKPSNWDGGTQTHTTLVACGDGGTRTTDTVHLSEFSAVVEWGTFCGKPATITVYMHPTRFDRIDPGRGPDMTDLGKSVLTAIATFNSRGRADFRAEQNMSKATWDSVVAELFSAGLTRKNGAITPAGRNAAR